MRLRQIQRKTHSYSSLKTYLHVWPPLKCVFFFDLFELYQSRESMDNNRDYRFIYRCIYRFVDFGIWMKEQNVTNKIQSSHLQIQVQILIQIQTYMYAFEQKEKKRGYRKRKKERKEERRRDASIKLFVFLSLQCCHCPDILSLSQRLEIIIRKETTTHKVEIQIIDKCVSRATFSNSKQKEKQNNNNSDIQSPLL